MNFPANHWNRIGHFYRPIAYYGGKVLKYEGIATEGNKEHNADAVILPEYLGDRITADTHEVFAG